MVNKSHEIKGPPEDILDEAEVHDSVEQKAAFLAEDLARFREGLLLQIFSQDIEPKLWEQTASTLLDDYPQLSNYKQLILETVSLYRIDNEKAQQIWNQLNGQTADKSKRNPALPNLDRADRDTEDSLYKYFFNAEPEGKIEVIKGKFSYIFILSDEAANQLHARLAPADEDFDRLGGFYTRIKGINVCVAVEGADLVPFSQHEIEHIHNNVIGRGRQLSIMEERHFNPSPSNIHEAIKRREERALPMEKRAKDEILALCTFLEVFERTVEFQKIKLSKDDVNQILNEFTEGVRQALANDEGAYLKTYIRSEEPTNEELEKYKRRAERALTAFMGLRNSYLSRYKNSLADRMAIYTLEQFPLHNWPAVARICRMRKDNLKEAKGS